MIYFIILVLVIIQSTLMAYLFYHWGFDEGVLEGWRQSESGEMKGAESLDNWRMK